MGVERDERLAVGAHSLERQRVELAPAPDRRTALALLAHHGLLLRGRQALPVVQQDAYSAHDHVGATGHPWPVAATGPHVAVEVAAAPEVHRAVAEAEQVARRSAAALAVTEAVLAPALVRGATGRSREAQHGG